MTPYIGEIRIFPGTFAPSGWLFCNGQLLSIADYDTLFALIGTSYGGDGQSQFALPDLRGRLPVHSGPTTPYASSGGSESVTLISQQTASHNHSFAANTAIGTSASPAGNIPAQSGSLALYSGAAPTVAMGNSSITVSPGGGSPHNNVQPYLCVNCIISLYGVWPSQS